MVRIYCLTSINTILENANFADISDDDIKEPIPLLLKKRDTPKIIKNGLEIFDQYKLTEISIGYDFAKDNKKFYAMNIFRRDIGSVFIKMVPGAVIFQNVSNNAFDLFVATSMLFPHDLNFDLHIKIRCIKNTKVKGRIEREEEEAYEIYSQKIRDFCEINSVSSDIALQRLPFLLPNLSEDNVLRTRISDFRILIDQLCNLQTGCYANVGKTKCLDDEEEKRKRECCGQECFASPRVESNTKRFYMSLFLTLQKYISFLDVRYDQKLRCLLEDDQWTLQNPRRFCINKDIKKYINCTSLTWNKVSLKDQNFVKFDPKRLEAVSFSYINAVGIKFLQHSLTNINSLCHLKYLYLVYCKIAELSDEFMKLLPISLERLDLQYNEIIFVSKHISRLTKLKELNLAMNENLCDNGFQWAFLPSSLQRLDLNGTSISNISSEIKSLTSIEFLSVMNLTIKYISWNDISPSIKWLFIGGSGEINAVNLHDKNQLSHLYINHAGLKEINARSLPSSIIVLNLKDNKLSYFDSKDKLLSLNMLNLAHNDLNEICWENLPETLQNIDASHNNLKVIGNVSRCINLKNINMQFNKIEKICETINTLPNLWSLNLNNNNIFELPLKFEECQMLEYMELNQNKFNHENEDLIEVLWKRLPLSLKTLKIDKNNLHYLPCLLKHLNISKLSADECNLTYMCPYLSSAIQNRSRDGEISIRKNVKLKYLPFVPKKIYISFSAENPIWFMRIITENANLRDSSKFKVCRLPFNFDYYDKDDNPFNCHCCASCGNKTDEGVVKQILVMDYKLIVGEKAQINENDEDIYLVLASLCTVHSVSNDNIFYHKNKRYEYLPGEWKANIVTRLCGGCLTEIKYKIKIKLDEYKKLQTEHFAISKMKKKKLEMCNFSSNVSNASTSPNILPIIAPFDIPHMEDCDAQNFRYSSDINEVSEQNGPPFIDNHSCATQSYVACNPHEQNEFFYPPQIIFPPQPLPPIQTLFEPYVSNRDFIYSNYHNHSAFNNNFQSSVYQKSREFHYEGLIQELPAISYYTIQDTSDIVNTRNHSEYLDNVKKTYSTVLAPTTPWLQEKCKNFGIPFFENVSENRQQIDDIQKFTIREHDDVINVPCDEHCGYSSISILISGSIFYHEKVRDVICSTILNNTDPNFEKLDIFRNAKAIASAKLSMDTTKPCSKEYWMDDGELAAAAFILNCNIYVLNSMNDWQIYGPKTFINGQMNTFTNYDPSLPTLLMQNISGNHFTPVKNVWLK